MNAAAFTMSDTGFPVELARFVAFVGSRDLERAVTRVLKKLSDVSPSLRFLYGNRYFFHEQCESFVDSSTPFQLDTTNLNAVRAASLIAGVNRVRDRLSAAAVPRFRSVVLSGMKPDRDLRHLEHE